MIGACRLCGTMVESPAAAVARAAGSVPLVGGDSQVQRDRIDWGFLGLEMFKHLAAQHPEVAARVSAATAMLHHYVSSLAFTSAAPAFATRQAESIEAVATLTGERSEVEKRLGVSAIVSLRPNAA
jgi:hypothetical protein